MPSVNRTGSDSFSPAPLVRGGERLRRWLQARELDVDLSQRIESTADITGFDESAALDLTWPAAAGHASGLEDEDLSHEFTDILELTLGTAALEEAASDLGGDSALDATVDDEGALRSAANDAHVEAHLDLEIVDLTQKPLDVILDDTAGEAPVSTPNALVPVRAVEGELLPPGFSLEDDEDDEGSNSLVVRGASWVRRVWHRVVGFVRRLVRRWQR